MSSMHLRVRRWVMWWFSAGIICGVIALGIIFGHNLTPTQEKIVLLMGVAHWLLFGVVCWAFESVKVESRPPAPINNKPAATVPERYWHPASDFLLPGRRKSLLPWRH